MEKKSLEMERSAFLKLAILFQGGLALIALGLSWSLGVSVTCRVSYEGIRNGIVATIPLLALLALVYQSRTRNLIQIRHLLQDVLGRPLSACSWSDLLALAALAGFSEELLFRGVLEPCISRWNPVLALIANNILFGLCHAVTPTYAILAGLMGGYLSLTMKWTSEPDLLVPICCHSLYDFVAFAVVRQSFRRNKH